MTNININTDTLRQALNGDEEAIKEARTLLPTPRTIAATKHAEKERHPKTGTGPF